MQKPQETVGLIPGWGRSPERGHGHPLHYSCLENPMDRGAWQTMESQSWTWLSNLMMTCLYLAGGLSSTCFNRALCQRIHELGSSRGSTIHWPHDPEQVTSPSWTRTLDPTDIPQRHFPQKLSSEGHIKVFPGRRNKILNAIWRSLNKQTKKKRFISCRTFQRL